MQYHDCLQFIFDTIIHAQIYIFFEVFVICVIIYLII